MDLGHGRQLAEQFDHCSPAELLAHAHSEVTTRRASMVREWAVIVAWADRTVVDAPAEAATIIEGVIDTGVPIAGPGAPLISEFQLMELVATLERSADGGRVYVGRVVECAWRLPAIYAEVIAGRVPTWRAEQVAALTRPLSEEAASYVDDQLARHLRTCSWAQVERLVDEAITRYDPELAERHRTDAADGRRFDIDLEDVHDGVVDVHGVMDATDGADLDAAISRRATALGRLGHDGSLDMRRSVAAGEIARADLALDLEVVDEETGEVTVASPGRRSVLHLHLSDLAVLAPLLLDRAADAGLSADQLACLKATAAVGRAEEVPGPVLASLIREWLQASSTVIVRPVIDLADHVPVDSWEIPHRHRERVRLRDHTCRHPGCHRKAARCDCDHAVPHGDGGPTCPCQLVPLCRRHHRAKTFSTWRYVIVQPGTYLWITPHGRHFLVDHRGTRALDTPRRMEPVDVVDQVHDEETGWPATEVIPPCPGTSPATEADRPASDLLELAGHPPDR